MESLSPSSFANISTRQPPTSASAHSALLTCLASPSQQRKGATIAIHRCSAAKANFVVTSTTANRTSSRASLIADADSSPQRKKVLVPIGYGTEEMEAIILVDVLRRAGAHVTVASVEPGLEIEGSGGTKLVADKSISKCSDDIFDLVALPGGMPGSARLRDSDILREITSKQAEEKRLYGAICAAPAITLLPWGLLRKKEMTCHPAFFHKLPTFWAVNSDIQVSGGATTSRGPATTFQFALSLVEQLYGESVANEIAELLFVGCSKNDYREKEFNEVHWTVQHSPSVLLPVANGSEEIEIVTVADILRRAKVNVVVASVERSLKISASSGTKIIADKSIGDAQDSTYDLIILPGGIAGADRLSKSKILKRLLKEQHTAGRIYGAICSSPTILQNQGLLKDKRATAHPSVIEKLNGEAVNGAKVVIDGKLITSRGLATVIDFALVIVSKLFGHGRARSVAEGLVLQYPQR